MNVKLCFISCRNEIFKSCHELSQEILSSTFKEIDHLDISENCSNNESVGLKELLPNHVLEELNFSTPEAVSLDSSSNESVNSVVVSEDSAAKNLSVFEKEFASSTVAFDKSAHRVDLDSPAGISNDLGLELSEKNSGSLKSIGHVDSYSSSPCTETSHLRSIPSETSSTIILVKKDATHRNIAETLNMPIYQIFDSREELNTSEDIAAIDANVKANETIQSNRDTNSLITLYEDSMYDASDEEYFHDNLGEDELYASHPSSYAYKFADPQCMDRSSNASMIAVLDFDLYGCNDVTDTASQVAGSSKD